MISESAKQDFDDTVEQVWQAVKSLPKSRFDDDARAELRDAFISVRNRALREAYDAAAEQIWRDAHGVHRFQVLNQILRMAYE